MRHSYRLPPDRASEQIQAEIHPDIEHVAPPQASFPAGRLAGSGGLGTANDSTGLEIGVEIEGVVRELVFQNVHVGMSDVLGLVVWLAMVRVVFVVRRILVGRHPLPVVELAVDGNRAHGFAEERAGKTNCQDQQQHGTRGRRLRAAGKKGGCPLEEGGQSPFFPAALSGRWTCLLIRTRWLRCAPRARSSSAAARSRRPELAACPEVRGSPPEGPGGRRVEKRCTLGLVQFCPLKASRAAFLTAASRSWDASRKASATISFVRAILPSVRAACGRRSLSPSLRIWTIVGTNAFASERISVLTLGSTPAFHVVRLHAPVLAALPTPDGKFAVVLHAADGVLGSAPGVADDGGAERAVNSPYKPEKPDNLRIFPLNPYMASRLARPPTQARINSCASHPSSLRRSVPDFRCRKSWARASG